MPHASKTERPSGCHEHSEFFEAALAQEEIIFLKKRLEQGLLSSASLGITPQEINSHLVKLEMLLPAVPKSIINRSKINMVLKDIVEKKDLSHDDEYRFKQRARALLTAHDRLAGAEYRRELVDGDVVVVGVVLLFIIAVIIMEMADMALSSLKTLAGIRSKGAIRLPADAENYKSFALMPAPKGRNRSLEKTVEKVSQNSWIF